MVLGINHTKRAAKHVAENKPHARRTATMGLSGRPLRWTITACSVTAFSLFGYDQGLMGSIITGLQFVEQEFKPLKYFIASEGETCPYPSNPDYSQAMTGNQWANMLLTGDPDASNLDVGAGANTYYCEKESRQQSVLQGGVTSSYDVGCFFGSIFVFFFGERIGRKPLVILGCFIVIVGVVISTASYGHAWGIGQFIVGRAITGVGNGMNTATIPVWQSEVSRPEIRGRLVNLEGSVVAIGTMVATWFDYGLHWIRGSSIAWRFPVALQAVFALIVIICVPNLPESPRWLVSKGRIEEARTVQAALMSMDPHHEMIEDVIAVNIEEVKRQGSAADLKTLFTNGKGQYLNRMLIGASTQFFQQITGCNAAIYYSTVLFQKMYAAKGKTDIQNTTDLPILLGGVFGCVYAAFTILSFILVDWVGRRWLFFWGAAGQAISFFISMACLAASSSYNSKKGKATNQQDIDKWTNKEVNSMKGGIVGLYLFIACFGTSILELPWVYPPEINPLKTRTPATALSTMMNWLWNFTVVMFTPVFIDESQWGCYLFFAIMNMLWLPVIYFYYPETAGRKLEEIDLIFARAHVEGKFPFMVASEMPALSDEEIIQEGRRLGLGLVDNAGNPLDRPDAKEGSAEGSENKRNSTTSSISALSNTGEGNNPEDFNPGAAQNV